MDLQEVFDAGFDAVKEYVDASFATFERRLVALEGKYVEAVGQITKLAGVPEQISMVDIKVASAIDLRKDIEGLRGSIEALPAKAAELPDVPALITQAVKALPSRDDLATVKGEIETLRFLVKELPAPEPLPDFGPIITDEVAKAVSAIEKPKDGHSPTAEELLPLFKQVALDAVAAIPRPKDGLNGANGQDGKDGANGHDGRDGLDAVKFFRAEGGALLVSLSNGEVRDLGEIVGPRGEMGERGLPGDTGPTGPQGEIGQSGRDGRDAEPVTREIIMDAVESTKALHAAVQNYLEQNPPAPGRDGRDGVDGKDGEKGLDGTHGLDGKDGKDGTNGNDGAPGADGRDGADGAKGLDGAEGQKGIDGISGRDGIDGKDGANGSDGANGLNGADGQKGQDAILPDLSVLEFAPAELSERIGLAVKKMMEFPQSRIAEVTEKSIPLPPINITLNQEPQPAPVVNMAAPHVTVTTNRGKEVTQVTGWDEKGRITSFEKTEVDK